jgi:hypothetical protein
MTDQSSIFTENQNSGEATPPNSAQTPNPLENLLKEIKNDKGEPKYASVEAALNALKHSQEYIPNLSQQLKDREAELEETRKIAAKTKELEATLQRIVDQQTSQPGSTVDPQEVAKIAASLVTKSIDEKTKAEVTQNNLKTVIATVQGKFGSEAEKVFYEKANEIGMSVQEFNTLAASNPKAVFKILGIEGNIPANGNPSANSTVNTANSAPNKQTFIRKNDVPYRVGSTTQELNQEAANARKLVEELHAQGKTIQDLTNPAVYFKTFGK